MSRRLFPKVLVPLLLAFPPLVGCTPAPLEGKACDQSVDAGAGADAGCASGYLCCRSTNRCLVSLADCPCSVVTLSDPNITTDGHPLDGEEAPTEVDGQLAFNTPPEQWVSYPFLSVDQAPPIAGVTSEVTPERDGFHVTATFDTETQGQTSYEGFGLTFRRGDVCVDGTNYTGVRFSFFGNLGGRPLATGVTSADDLTIIGNEGRGTCKAELKNCYGPTYPLPDATLTSPTPISVSVPFTQLHRGSPNDGLTPGKIINVQWQLGYSTNRIADFTIRNLEFY